MSKSKLDWALEMVDRGLAVFPVVWTDAKGNCSCGNPDCKHKGKHPLPGSNGFKDATIDKGKIREWWAETPNANYGVWPGKDFVVVDLDVKGGKVDGIANIEKFLGKDSFELYPETYAVQSPSGGVHLYYRTDTPFGDKLGLLPGVDIRAQVGYVVGPGSAIGAKSYEVISDSSIGALPPKLVEVLNTVRQRQEDASVPLFDWDTPGAITRARAFLRVRKPAIEGQGGNAHTYATAVLMKDFAISEEMCTRLMMEDGGWNDRCEPPWTREELAGVVGNAYRYGKDRPGSKGASLIDELDIDDEIQDISQVLKNSDDPFAKYRAHALVPSVSLKLERNYEFVAYGWVPAQGYTAVLSDRGVGKSTVLIDFCMRLACDMDWHGTPLDTDWKIQYIVGEDMEGALARQKAWCQKHQVIPDDSRFQFMDMPIDVTDPEEVKNYALYVREVTRGQKKVLFVLDTWQRMTAFADGGQNDDIVMQKAIYNVESLARSFSGPCLIAFHPPKANKGTIMGSSILENSSHAIINLTLRESGIRKLQVTRIKGCEDNHYMDILFDKVEYGGVNQLGIPLSGPVPRSVGEGREGALDTHNAIALIVKDICEGVVNHVNPNLGKEISLTDIAWQIESIPKLAEMDKAFAKWKFYLDNISNGKWKYTEIEGEQSFSKVRSSDSMTALRAMFKGRTKTNPYETDKIPDRIFYLENKGNNSVVRMEKVTSPLEHITETEIEEYLK